jgi:4'-phosphopantetheinyl transferase
MENPRDGRFIQKRHPSNELTSPLRGPDQDTVRPLQPLHWRLGEPTPPLPGVAEPPLLVLNHCSDVEHHQGEALLATLSPEERERHDTYRRPADRLRFLVARASLRQLLGTWLALPPAAIPIPTSRQGKPHCPSPGAPAFNLSHSGDLILLAFHPSMEVGVDVEESRLERPWRRLAERVLPPGQVLPLEALPRGEQPRGFLLAWCRLEAQLKARGVGLAGLERLRETTASGEAAECTLLWDVGVPSPYAAAVALHERQKGPSELAFTAHRAPGARAAHPSLPG